MYELPTKITIKDKDYQIRNDGDYRMILDCFSALQDAELSQNERLIVSLAIFYEGVSSLESLYEMFTPEDLEEAVQCMYNFFNCNGSDIGNRTSYKLVDWEQDEQMIVSAVNKVAGTEIRAVPYMHWFTFMGYYGAVGKSTLSTVVEIRSKLKKGKKLEKYEQEFRQENPQYFVWNSRTVEDDEADNWLKSVWNKE